MTDWFANFLKTQDNLKTSETHVVSTEINIKKNQYDKDFDEFIEKEQKKDDNSTRNSDIEDLIKKIKDYRAEQATAKKLPLYCIFANSVIDDIVTYLPSTPEQLIKIKGFGKKTLEQYGETVLLYVNSFLEINLK